MLMPIERSTKLKSATHHNSANPQIYKVQPIINKILKQIFDGNTKDPDDQTAQLRTYERQNTIELKHPITVTKSLGGESCSSPT